MERESEELDQSFQAYLRRQNILKQQMNDDASKIWENYSESKAALAKFDKIDNKHAASNGYHPNLVDVMPVEQVYNSTFQDDVDVQEVLKDLNDIKRLSSPRFNKNVAFPQDNLIAFKSHVNKFESIGHKEKIFERPTIVDKHEMLIQMPRPTPFRMTEKPIEKITKQATANIVAESLTISKQIENIKSSTENQLKEGTKPAKINASDESNLKRKENLEVANEIETVKTIEKKISETEKNEKIAVQSLNEKVIEKSLSEKVVEINRPATLTNGFSKESLGNNDTVKTENKISSPVKVNGTRKLTEPKVDVIEKLPTTASFWNGLSPEKKINGIASKLTTFVSTLSESDSGSAEVSELISIGQQRLIKSPDDLWI